jgi:hypothetical protein
MELSDIGPMHYIFFIVGIAIGSAAVLIIKKYMESRNDMLSFGQMNKLNIDPEDDDNAKAFTYKKERQIATAEKKVAEVSQTVKLKDKAVQKCEESLQSMRKKLADIINDIQSAETKGQKQDFIKNNLAGHLKLMADESMEYSTTLDAHLRFRMSLRFWNQVANGEGKKTSIKTLTKRKFATSEQDNRLSEVLETANETLRLGESEFDRAMETWVAKADSL